jgi:hypothetical protein
MPEAALRLTDEEVLRTSRLMTIATEFVFEIETAEPSAPISIDSAGQCDQSLQECLKTELERADTAYARHRQIFRPNGRSVAVDDLDLPAILDNTRTVLGIVRPVNERRRGLILGLATTQLGGLALALTERPELLRIPTQTDPTKTREITSQQRMQVLDPDQLTIMAAMCAHYDTTADELFQNSLAPILLGDVSKIPFYKFGCGGFLLDFYYRFWEQFSNVRTIPLNIQADLAKLKHQFPAKTATFDGHTALGRPSYEEARAERLLLMNDYSYSLASTASKGTALCENFGDPLKEVFLALNALASHGYDKEDCVRAVARHINALGRLSERANADQPVSDSFTITGSHENPEIVMAHPTDEADISDVGRRRLQGGGICPARRSIAVPTEGIAHRGALAIIDAIDGRSGVRPSFLRDIGGVTYLNPAAFIVGISLLGAAENWQAN